MPVRALPSYARSLTIISAKHLVNLRILFTINKIETNKTTNTHRYVDRKHNQ